MMKTETNTPARRFNNWATRSTRFAAISAALAVVIVVGWTFSFGRFAEFQAGFAGMAGVHWSNSLLLGFALLVFAGNAYLWKGTFLLANQLNAADAAQLFRKKLALRAVISVGAVVVVVFVFTMSLWLFPAK